MLIVAGPARPARRFLGPYVQQVLGCTPLSAGFASLPTTAGVLVAAGTASRLVPCIGPGPLMVAGKEDLPTGSAVPAG